MTPAVVFSAAITIKRVPLLPRQPVSPADVLSVSKTNGL
jgi:hypothetical protein